MMVNKKIFSNFDQKNKIPSSKQNNHVTRNSQQKDGQIETIRSKPRSQWDFGRAPRLRLSRGRREAEYRCCRSCEEPRCGHGKVLAL